MNYYHIAILSIIQGLTEFIPVSSSAHLILLPKLTSWPDQGLGVDVGLHLGSLGAICIYFFHSLKKMVQGLWRFLWTRELNKEARQAVLLVIATLPALIGGALIHKFFGHRGESLGIIGMVSVIFGVVLWAADRYSPSHRLQEELTYGQALILGLGQVIALSIPGASRLGCCLTLSRLLGMSRKESLEFSFLLAIPTILGAATLLVFSGEGIGGEVLKEMSWAMGLTALMGIVTLSGILKWTQSHGFALFSFYRVGLGLILICLHLMAF
jgi:undecaprenyl-diphosphatase